MKRDTRMVYIGMVTDRARARNNGKRCLRTGNLLRAWRWFSRYDDLKLLEIRRAARRSARA